MSTRTAAALPKWAAVSAAVEVERVPAPAFYSTAYRVFVDGEEVGVVASRQERGHTTLWAHARSLDALHGAASPSRPLALEALVESLSR